MQALISSKPYKQFCRARGLDFATHMQGFPLVARRLNIPRAFAPIIKKSFWQSIWEKVKAFFNY